MPLEAWRAYGLLLLSRSRISSLAVANRALLIARASAIADLVFALGTLRAKGNCCSATTRVRNTRIASERDKPIAASVSVAWALICSSTRTWTIVLAAIGNSWVGEPRYLVSHARRKI